MSKKLKKTKKLFINLEKIKEMFNPTISNDSIDTIHISYLNDTQKKLKKLINKHRLLIIYGEKGIGKTNTLKKIANEHNNIFYTNIQKLNLFLKKNLKNKIYFYTDLIKNFDIIIFDEFSDINLYQYLNFDFNVFFKNFLKNKNKKLVLVYNFTNIDKIENNLNQFGIKKFKLFKINNPSLKDKIKFIEKLKEKENIKLDINRTIFVAQKSRNYKEIYENITKKKFIYYKDDLDKVIMEVSKFFGVPMEEVLSSGRKRKIVLARQVIFYVLKYVYNYSIKNISQIFKKQHSAIIYGLKKVESLKKLDKKVKNIITTFEHQIHKIC